MKRTEFVGFRITEVQREKLNLLAKGAGTSLSGIFCQLLDAAPAREVVIQTKGLQLIESGRAQSTTAYQ